MDTAASRNADLAAIHIGKKALHWDDSTYRDLLWTICQVRSAGDLDFAGRKRFLDHMRKCGFDHKGGGEARRRPFTGLQGKIWSLWQQLADAGRVRDRRMTSLDTWVKAQLGVDKMLFLNPQQQGLAVERLKAWLARDPADEASHAA